mmetsp:Transcript_41349/g.99620  ORF Transcript_41349/g.99620 Transcript_41349/m.99620 type:complete len:216 (+) Transcript_41349:497-1144(+)
MDSLFRNFAPAPCGDDKDEKKLADIDCLVFPCGDTDGEIDGDTDRETDRDTDSRESDFGFLPRTGVLESSGGEKGGGGGEILLVIIAACRSGDNRESSFSGFLPRPDDGLSGLFIRFGGEILLCIRFWKFDSSAFSVFLATPTFWASSISSNVQVPSESSDCHSSADKLPSNFFPLDFFPSFPSSPDSEDSQDATDDSGVGDRARFAFLRCIEAA